MSLWTIGPWTRAVLDSAANLLISGWFTRMHEIHGGPMLIRVNEQRGHAGSLR